ncbi:sugar transferase [Mediterraneibacter faecis]
MEKKYYKLSKKQLGYSKIKSSIDKAAAIAGTVLLSPIFLGIVVAIKKEEGINAPVFFKQKRVGQNQQLFDLYKFRTMKLTTPKDTPTHLLSNPEQYITSTGKFLRRSSLDELPQFFNIIKGDMAISGPRPALWNQDDLIAEREAYGVHQIKPGLTGWAQIHGRDELEIPVKAKLDAYYLQHYGLWIDIKCFFGTILSVLKSDGVVEGGTGEIKKKEIESNDTNSKDCKKILFVANVAKEHILKFHIPTIKMLRHKGYRVDVACSVDADIPECDELHNMSYERNPFSLKTIKGIWEMRKLFKKGNYDVVSCHTPTGGLVARIASIGLKKRPYIIYTAHGFHFFKGAPAVNWLVYFPVEWILSYLTDELIVINKEDYNNALKYKMGMKRITLLHGMGVDKEHFSKTFSNQEKSNIRKELGIPENEFVFTYVAEILENKNQKVLLHALKNLREKTGKGWLLLVGPIHDDGKTEELAELLKIKKYVTFTGWRNDIDRIFAATDVCTASSIREGLGLNLVEAQFSKIPVIASDNRGHRDVIVDGENGFLVDTNDYKEYSKAMYRLMTDGCLRTQFVERALESSVIFSRESILAQLEDIYERCCK